MAIAKQARVSRNTVAKGRRFRRPFCAAEPRSPAAARAKKPKAKRTVQMLAEEGAAIVSDYAGLVQVLAKAPGT